MDVSIIMPAYNVEKYIGEAIDSVLAQKFNGTIELIIVDDASTDSTAEIISAYQSRYVDLIRFSKREVNMGANANRYEFSQKTRGRYLAFLDADDFWLTNDKLQRQVDCLEANENIGAICSNAYYVDNQRISFKSEGQEGFVPFQEMISGYTDIFCSSLVCRKEVYLRMADDSKWFIENGCFNDTLWAFWLSYHSLLYRMKDALSAYRVLDNSSCHSTNPEKRIFLSKRYFKEKLCFLFTHDYPLEEKMDIVSKEYDYIRNNAFYEGEKKVRDTKTFRIGKKIKSQLQLFDNE